MIKKQQQFIPKGMNQDIAQTKVQSELAHSIKNLRVITDETDGTLSLVTEKGTTLKELNNEINVSFKKEYTTLTLNKVDEWRTDYTYLNNINLGTISGNTFLLCYSTYTAIIKATFTFNYDIDRNNFVYDENLIPNFFSIPISKMRNNIDLGKGSAKLIYSPSDFAFLIYDVNGTLLNDRISFANINYELCKFQIENDRTISIYIPALYLDYRINASPVDFDTFDNNWLFSFKYSLQQLKNWNCTATINLGNIIGNCVINNQLILFTTDNNYDKILKYENFNTDDDPLLLYSGDLNFNIDYPIQTYVSYESENQQRVYWIDGLNQPRVINVTKQYESFDDNQDNHFNFSTPIYCEENISIRKNAIGGYFHSGVIQYFMTYVDQNQQESKIFYASPLYYLTDNKRSLSPEESSTNSFKISINNVNANKLLRNKLRIYSLQRTSLNAVPVAKLVFEIKLAEETSNLVLIDTGTVGMNVDPQIILMLGCEEFIPQAMAVKDNTIFFGNIETKNYQEVNNVIAENFITNAISISRKRTHEHINAAYSSNFQLNGTDNLNNLSGSDNEIKGFMYNEEYMLGLQFLHKSGDWTEPIWVGDFIMENAPTVDTDYQYVPYFSKTFSNNIIYVNDNDENDIRIDSATGYTAKGIFNYLIDKGYIAARPLIVFNDQQNSRVLCQGILNQTIKYSETKTYYPSWFFRARNIESSRGLLNFGDNFRIPEMHEGLDLSAEVQGFGTRFTVQNNLMTFNSPEIEFEKITSLNNNYSFKYIGVAPIHANTYDIEMQTSTTPFKGYGHLGLNVSRGILWYENAKQTFIGGYCWKDKNFEAEERDGIYYIWPWENNQSYSCAPKNDEDVVWSAPDKKTISNYKYSQYFIALAETYDCTVNHIYLANTNYIRTEIKDTDSEGDKEYVYLKDIDLLCIGTVSENSSDGGGNRHVKDYDSSNATDCNSVRIQCKSTPHIVLNLSDTTNHYFGGANSYAQLQIGELINSDYSETTKFKGRLNGKPTETSMYENTWYIAGNKTLLKKDSTLSINWTKGDTYFQRYDCLKTYPYSHDAPNSIIEVLSCMIQTRVNIDGRYDKNRCSDILHIDPTNFNKLNDIYSQQDNFFTYHKMDPDRFQNTFPNLIVWSRQKSFGESIDSWTNIHLVNTLDLDGSLGKLNSINLWNNSLITFQDKGIAVLRYNENAMLQSNSGLNIELANSGLVTGREYLTNQFGCQNKWSIVNAKTGLYFSDDYNHKLYALHDGLKCISDELGFRSYLKTKNYSGIWKPNRIAESTLKTFYNQPLGEIYFTDGKDCLTYNEQINLFTSFYDYKDTGDNKLFDLINIKNKSYWILNNFTNTTPSFYNYRASDYLNIFNVDRDYSIELTSNLDAPLDKIFDGVEIRGDCWENDNLQSGYGCNPPFNKIQTVNEYQDTGYNTLNFVKDRPNTISNIKQKFRIWRANIGRNQNSRDRIRNMWSRITLTKEATTKLKAKIHDIIVNVYE